MRIAVLFNLLLSGAPTVLDIAFLLILHTCFHVHCQRPLFEPLARVLVISSWKTVHESRLNVAAAVKLTCCWLASGFSRLWQASRISSFEFMNWAWSIRPGLPATLDGSATATKYAAWKKKGNFRKKGILENYPRPYTDTSSLNTITI